MVDISLNAENAELYNKVTQPLWGEETYPAILEFIKECVAVLPVVECTVVTVPEIDVEKCRQQPLTWVLPSGFGLGRCWLMNHR